MTTIPRRYCPACDTLLLSSGACRQCDRELTASQSDAEIGAIVRAALNRYFDATPLTAGKQLALDHVVSAEVTEVRDHHRVTLVVSCRARFEGGS